MKNQSAFEIIEELHNQGLSYEKIAKELNSRGVKTKLGKTFSGVTAYNVHKVYKRPDSPVKTVAAAPEASSDKAYFAYVLSNLESCVEALRKLL